MMKKDMKTKKMNIKKEIRLAIEEKLELYYGGKRLELIKGNRYSEFIELNNRVMEYLEGRGEKFGPMYFPRKENPKSRCGSCFSRVIRNLSWVYFYHCLGNESSLEVMTNRTTGEKIEFSDRGLPVPLQIKKKEDDGTKEASKEEPSDSAED